MLIFNGIYILMSFAVAYVYVIAVRNHSSKISNIFILFMFIQILACISSFALIPIGTAKLVEWFISFKMFEIAITFLPLVWFMFVYEYLGKKINKPLLFIFGGIYFIFFINNLYKDLDHFTVLFFNTLSPKNINNNMYIYEKATLIYFIFTFILFMFIMFDYIKELRTSKRKLKKEILIITILILIMIFTQFYVITQILYSLNITMFLVLLIALMFLRLVVNNDIKNLIQISNSLILDEIPTVILILDSQKNIVYANKRAYEVFENVDLNEKYDLNERLLFVNYLDTNESFEKNKESKISVYNSEGNELTFNATRTAHGGEFEIIRLQDITSEERNLESLHKKSRVDGLTGLMNKSTFYHESNLLMELCNSLCQICAVVMFDLDKFKYVNDTYGHQKGDEVLIKLAKFMNEEIILQHHLARFGGEEFCGLIVGEPQEVYEMLENFRENFKKIKFDYEGGTFNVTLSMGVAFNSYGDDLETLLECADKALYESKNSGRDRITVYEPEFY